MFYGISTFVGGICRTSHQTDECGTRPFLGGSGAGPKSTCGRRFQKCLGPRRHSPKKGRLRRQAINLTTPRRVKAWGDGPLRLEDVSQGTPWPTDRPPPQPEHTRPDPCLPNTADRSVKWLGRLFNAKFCFH